MQELKQICRILFIDDGEFDVPGILVTSGWRHTKKLSDVESLDCTEIAESHVIFIDIAGVGKRLRFTDEGLGLLTAIKKRYPVKKLVVYSAQQRGNRFHEGLSQADERLPKNADPFQFENLVENLAQDAFSLVGCIHNLKKVLDSEFKIYLSDSDIERILTKIGRKGVYTDTVIARAFNLQNAGSWASVISLFFEVLG